MRKGGDKIEPEFLFVFMSFLYHYKMKVVPSKVLLTELSKKLKISQQIRKLLFQNDRYLKNDSSEKSPTSSCRDDNKKRENPEFQSDLEMERLYNKEHYHAKVEQLLRTSSPSRVLKQYNILKLMVNNNSIPNISFAHKRNPLIDIQKEGDNKLDQNWHKRMSVSFRRDQQLVKDSEPQDVFYINDYFKTLEEFYYYKLFQNRIDEQPVDDKVKDYIEFIRENSNIDMPCHTTLVVIHSK